MMECFWAIIIKFESFQLQPSLGFLSYTDPWPLDLDPSFENEQQFHGARGLSSVPLRQATFHCVDYQARRGGGTTIPYHDSLLGRSLASPKVVVRSLRRSRDAPH